MPSPDLDQDWIDTLAAALPREGQRVRLRPYTVDDIDREYELSAPDAAWRDFNGPYSPERPTWERLAEIRDRRKRFVGEGRTVPRGQKAVVADLETDAFLGDVGWYFQNFPALNWPALGIVLMDETCWGRGIGTEALGMWADLLFEVEPAFHRADLRTWSGNERMCRLAQRLGFVEEARFREACVVRGARYDSVGYGILRREWQARYPDGFAT